MGGTGSHMTELRIEQETARQAKRAADAAWAAAVRRHPALQVIIEDHWRRAALTCSSEENQKQVLARYLRHSAARAQRACNRETRRRVTFSTAS